LVLRSVSEAGCFYDYAPYRDKKVVGVFCAFSCRFQQNTIADGGQVKLQMESQQEF
jgi:hypothetical protein